VRKAEKGKRGEKRKVTRNILASDPDAGAIQVVASQSQFYALRNPPTVKASKNQAPKDSKNQAPKDSKKQVPKDSKSQAPKDRGPPRANLNFEFMTPVIDFTAGNGKFLDAP
jgi:hypothetical protein